MSLQEVHACVDEMYTDDFSVEAEKKIADVQVRPARAYISFRKTIVGYCYLNYVTIAMMHAVTSTRHHIRRREVATNRMAYTSERTVHC